MTEGRVKRSETEGDIKVTHYVCVCVYQNKLEMCVFDNTNITEKTEEDMKVACVTPLIHMEHDSFIWVMTYSYGA